MDAYIEKSEDFAKPILRKMRKLFHQGCPSIEETMKWGVPHFEKKGIVGGMAAFQKHVSLGFWKGDLMRDPEGILGGKGKTMCAVKFGSVADLPKDKVLLEYVREAVDLNEKGVKKPASRRRLVTPKDLSAALKRNKKARETYEGFSLAKRREYVDWITGASREETRKKRLAQAVEWMAEGKTMNWKYR